MLKIANVIDIPTTLKDLKDQLLWGHNFVVQFWFQWNLILITLLYIFIIFLFKNNFLLILQLLAIFSYALQYSEYNKQFYNFLALENRESLGRLAEMIPYSVTGFSLASYEILIKLQKYKFKTIFFSLIVFCFIEKYEIFSVLNGVAYSGIKLNVHSISIIFLFFSFPMEKITNIYINKLLFCISSYTAGIFYLHWTVINYLKPFIIYIKNGELFGCIIVYLVCYIICHIGTKIFKNTKFKYLFN